MKWTHTKASWNRLKMSWRSLLVELEIAKAYKIAIRLGKEYVAAKEREVVASVKLAAARKYVEIAKSKRERN